MSAPRNDAGQAGCIARPTPRGLRPATAEPPSGAAGGPTPSVLFTPERIKERVGELGTEICAGYPAGCEFHLLSVLKGGVVFVADLMRAIAGPVTVDFVRLASYGPGTRPAGPPRLTKDLDDDVAGRDVLIVEDMVDTGQDLGAADPPRCAPGTPAPCAPSP